MAFKTELLLFLKNTCPAKSAGLFLLPCNIAIYFSALQLKRESDESDTDHLRKTEHRAQCERCLSKYIMRLLNTLITMRHIFGTNTCKVKVDTSWSKNFVSARVAFYASVMSPFFNPEDHKYIFVFQSGSSLSKEVDRSSGALVSRKHIICN